MMPIRAAWTKLWGVGDAARDEEGAMGVGDERVICRHSRRVRVLLVSIALGVTLASLVVTHAAQANAQSAVRADGIAPAGHDEAPSGSGEAGGFLGPTVRDAQGNEYVAGELIVSYASDAAERAAARSVDAASFGRGEVRESLGAIDARVFSFGELKREGDPAARWRGLEAAKKRLEAMPGVESVSYNPVQHQEWAPNDPYYRNGDQAYLGAIGAPAGWDYPNSRGTTADGKFVKIAVIDSGFDPSRRELCFNYDASTARCRGKTVAQIDYVRHDYVADDEQFHGTAVASVAAAATNNAIGLAGASPNAQLVIAKVADKGGNSDAATSAKAVTWAADQGVRVINMSFSSNVYVPALKDALDYAYYKKNALPVCASGSGGSDGVGGYGTKVYPAAYPTCLAVGASAGTARARFSDYGPYLDVLAPGENVVIALPAGREPSYGKISGTSFAAPIAAGLAADVISRKPSLSAAKVKATIEKYADDLGPAGRDDRTGHGRVNFQRAIRYAPEQ
jgi:thermitase